MSSRRESLAKGDTLASSFLLKKMNRKQHKRGVSFLIKKKGGNLDYIFIESPRKIVKNLENRK